MVAILEWVWAATGLYALAGLVLLLPFHMRALRAIDESTVGAGMGFRVLISPSLVALWPVVLRKGRGAGVAAAPDRPVSASTIRRLQKHLTRAVAVAVPIAVGLALAGRVEFAAVEPPEVYSSSVEFDDGNAFGDLPIHYKNGPNSQLMLAVKTDLELPATVLFIDDGPKESLTESAIALGGIWGPATFSFAIPMSTSSNAMLKIYSLADGAVVGTADLPDARS